MRKTPEISIIIPFFNERDCIHILLQTIEDYYNRRKFDFDIVFVNDGSSDGTDEIIKKITTFPCKLINLSKNFGSHAAIRAGAVNSMGRFITFLPADLQISLDTVDRLYNSIIEGNDVVYAIREVSEIGLIEKLFSRMYAFLMRKFVHKDYPNSGIETVMINEKVKRVFNENTESNSSFILQILSMGFKNKYLNIEKAHRSTGKTKWSTSKKIKLLIDSFVAFSFAPIRMVSIIGILLFLIGSGWSIYIVIRKLFFNDLVSGWPALLCLLLIGFGITNISLGIIAEYLWRTLDASRKRPVFIVDEIIELNEL
ncbi:MAG: glycosyltransferase [Bacteroidetes bacterium]|nr:glycosyltransferase [Bacteroidota bacterium]